MKDSGLENEKQTKEIHFRDVTKCDANVIFGTFRRHCFSAAFRHLICVTK